jgi:hypothetical protein
MFRRGEAIWDVREGCAALALYDTLIVNRNSAVT